jgi:hypothetical protein
MFLMDVLPPTSGSKSKPNKPARMKRLLAAWFLLVASLAGWHCISFRALNNITFHVY